MCNSFPYALVALFIVYTYTLCEGNHSDGPADYKSLFCCVLSYYSVSFLSQTLCQVQRGNSNSQWLVKHYKKSEQKQ